MDFNTSYVSVKQIRDAFADVAQAHFNTSYVSVKPDLLYSFKCECSYFNTSYVSVKLLENFKINKG